MRGDKINQLAKLDSGQIQGRLNHGNWRRGTSVETLNETIRQIEEVRALIKKVGNVQDWKEVFSKVHTLPPSHSRWNRREFERNIGERFHKAHYAVRYGKKSETEVLNQIDQALINVIADMRKTAQKWEAEGGFEKIYERQSRGVAKHNRMLKAALPRAMAREENEARLRKEGSERAAEKMAEKFTTLVQELKDQKRDPVFEGQVMARTSTGHKIIFQKDWKGVSGFKISLENASKHSKKTEESYSTYEAAANKIIQQMGARWKVDSKWIQTQLL